MKVDAGMTTILTKRKSASSQGPNLSYTRKTRSKRATLAPKVKFQAFSSHISLSLLIISFYSQVNLVAVKNAAIANISSSNLPPSDQDMPNLDEENGNSTFLSSLDCWIYSYSLSSF
jgi:hypothetical protein